MNRKPCMNPLCRSEGIHRRAKVRGLCDACYRALLRKIAAGEATMEEAERAGWCRAVPDPGRQRFPNITRQKASEPTTTER